MDKISALIKESCEDTARRQLSVKQGMGSDQNPTMLATSSQTSSLQSCEKQISVVYKPPSL